ncbi:MAG TPA: hypothetical protein PK926_07865 [Spirochaetota bacterium]|nr:hypothetical protein [Spirochaetota bacterium]HPI90275.1 hypothetical protein [Spirochaetota bacterium]HPR46387.1 hypothetical protein [Spirochaetota bacterium]
MRTIIGICSFVVSAALFLACTPSGPLTPREAFTRLKNGVDKMDSEAVAGLLSRESLEEIRTVSSLFKTMQPEQLESVARYYNTSPDTMRSLKPSDYVSLVLARDYGNNTLRQAVASPLLDIERRGNTAAIKLQNGMNLLFVREGPYWKFQLKDY